MSSKNVQNSLPGSLNPNLTSFKNKISEDNIFPFVKGRTGKEVLCVFNRKHSKQYIEINVAYADPNFAKI